MPINRSNTSLENGNKIANRTNTQTMTRKIRDPLSLSFLNQRNIKQLPMKLRKSWPTTYMIDVMNLNSMRDGTRA